MSTVVLDIRTPGVPECLASITRLTLWECLRRFGRPTEARDLASTLERSESEVQADLDALLAIGLVGRRAAGRGHRSRWTVEADGIVVKYRLNDADDESRLERMGRLFDDRRRKEIRVATKSDRERGPADFSFQSLHAARFDADDIRELWNLLQKIESFFHRVNLKRGDGGETRAGDDCNYHASIDVAALRPGVRALPSLQIIGDHVADEVAAGSLTDPLAGLTAREAEIARLMVAGRSRPQIAKDLEVTENTVREYGRRIYRKLGVRSRVDLAMLVRDRS
ncbi:MAG: hypothetical protein RLZZ461_1862 [Planctomycetota bacterium]|jgi:DNA-binding CsgD family transcriptional regulator/predicted transcriptional regulator